MQFDGRNLDSFQYILFQQHEGPLIPALKGKAGLRTLGF